MEGKEKAEGGSGSGRKEVGGKDWVAEGKEGAESGKREVEGKDWVVEGEGGVDENAWCGRREVEVDN